MSEILTRKEKRDTEKTDAVEIENAIKNLHKKQSEIEELLILRLEPLIKKKCRHYFGYYDEDFLQMGRIRLLELIRNFDCNREGVLFLGYVTRFLDCFFWDLKKKEMLQQSRYNFVEINKSLENQLSYEDKAFSDIILRESMNNLTPDEKFVVEKNIMQNLSLKKLAKEIDKSHEQLKYIKKKAIEKLKKSL